MVAITIIIIIKIIRDLTKDEEKKKTPTLQFYCTDHINGLISNITHSFLRRCILFTDCCVSIAIEYAS